MMEKICWQDLRPCRETMLEQPFPEEMHLVVGICARAVCEELQPVGRTNIGEVYLSLDESVLPVTLITELTPLFQSTIFCCIFSSTLLIEGAW